MTNKRTLGMSELVRTGDKGDQGVRANDFGLDTTFETTTMGLHNLSESLPLSTPFSLQIDPTNLCNFKCTFCPWGHPDLLKSVGRPTGMMEYGLFEKIVKDIKQFDKKIRKVSLYKDGESLMHEKFPQMISHVKSSDVCENVHLTTNGSLLTEKKSIEIIEAGLDTIRISVEHVHDAGYQEITQKKFTYAEIKKNVEFLFKEKSRRGSSLQIHAKLADTGLSAAEKEKFCNDFVHISDVLNIFQLNMWHSAPDIDFTLGTQGADARSPSIPGREGLFYNAERKICPDIFYNMSVNFNGIVSACVADWSMAVVLGDVNRQSLKEIWNGDKLKELRLMHIEGKRDQVNGCSTCTVLHDCAAQSDLDGVSDHLLSVYSGSGTCHLHKS